jgi:hypothetical protein
MAACMWAILASSLSVSGKIEQYGAYAGFAAVLGLAVLSLLYFAQAREVKRLREWAGRAPERAADLSERVQSDASRRVVAQPQRPVPAQPGQAPAAAAAAAAARPAAATPAGQAQGVPGAAPAGAAAAAATAAGAATATPRPPGAPPAVPGAQPTTVQPAPNGAAAGPVPQPKPGQPLRVPGAATPPPGRPGGGATPPPEPEKRGRSIFAIVGAAAGIIVVGAVLVFVVFGVGSGGGTKPANTVGKPGASASKSASGTATTPKSGTTASGAPKPGTYTVSVLNGTAVPGLARGVANRLQNVKFKIGNVTNAADQQRSQTLVEYAPGHRAEAASVAKAIDVGADAIQPVDAGSRAIAGEQSAVVVIVGADQNQQPQSP